LLDSCYPDGSVQQSHHQEVLGLVTQVLIELRGGGPADRDRAALAVPEGVAVQNLQNPHVLGLESRAEQQGSEESSHDDRNLVMAATTIEVPAKMKFVTNSFQVVSFRQNSGIQTPMRPSRAPTTVKKIAA